MKAPLSWLRDFAPLEADADFLSGVLNELGLVVDGVARVGEGLDGVVVARVQEIRPIEGADRIRAVTVDVAGQAVGVVCGAWNFSEGDLVPLATVGSVLPGNFAIARRKMRGVVSDGMLCSAAELGLSGDHGGIFVLPPGLATGQALTEAMGIEPDLVFELDITPNRPDAMSVAGVARDLAAALHLPFSVPSQPGPTPGAPAAGAGHGSEPARTLEAGVQTQDRSLCPLFSARVLDGVTVGSSPDWVARRLTLAGMRPINSVVDASNYVMLELGQPTHPYDLDKVAGARLVARAARAGESLVTLDGVERALLPSDCVIADGDDRAVGIAGVMGGQSSEISTSTRRVLVEAAYFTPMAVARTAQRLGLRSEASARFERGCDPGAAEPAAERVARLAALSGGNTLVLPTSGAVPPRPKLTLRPGRVNQLLGTDLATAEMTAYLDRIGFGVSGEAAGPLVVEVPGWRPDVTGEVDLIEEVARHHGYARIPRRVPPATQVGGLTPHQRTRRRLRQVLVGAGLTEGWTSSLLAPGEQLRAGLGPDPESLTVTNPMSQEESVLRRSQLPGLLRAVRYNLGHRHDSVRLFEIGTVFAPRAPADTSPLPVERELLSCVLAAPGDDAAWAVRLWRTVAAGLRLPSFELDPVVRPGLHPTRSARLIREGLEVGEVGEVDPLVGAAFEVDRRVAWLCLDLTAVAASAECAHDVVPVSVFPSADFDLAFTVEDPVPAGRLEQTLREAAGPALVELALFDVYRDPAVLGTARRSLAWHLRVASPDHTLTEAELAELRGRCVAAVEAAHPAQLRG
jgi:phenylalanyl-tRNA synthetase beta chain